MTVGSITGSGITVAVVVVLLFLVIEAVDEMGSAALLIDRASDVLRLRCWMLRHSATASSPSPTSDPEKLTDLACGVALTAARLSSFLLFIVLRKDCRRCISTPEGGD